MANESDANTRYNLIEYDPVCKTYWPGMISDYINETKACYFFSTWTAQNVDVAKYHCKKMNSRLIYFKSLKEWYIIRDYMQKTIPRKSWREVNYWMPFRWNESLKKWTDYETDEIWDTQIFRAPRLPDTAHDKKYFGKKTNEARCSATGPLLGAFWTFTTCWYDYFRFICKKALL